MEATCELDGTCGGCGPGCLELLMCFRARIHVMCPELRLRFHGYCNAFRYDAERRKGRGSVGLGGNVAKSLQEIERTLAASRTQHVQSTPLLRCSQCSLNGRPA